LIVFIIDLQLDFFGEAQNQAGAGGERQPGPLTTSGQDVQKWLGNISNCINPPLCFQSKAGRKKEHGK